MRTIIFLLLVNIACTACAYAATDSLAFSGISGIVQQSPNTTTTGTIAPHLAGRTSAIQGELLIRYTGLEAYHGFPGGVTVHQTVVGCLAVAPHVAVDYNECTGQPINNSRTWNNYPGPATKGMYFGSLGFAFLNTPAVNNFSHVSPTLRTNLQQKINNNISVVQIVYYRSNISAVATMILVPTVTVTAYLNGDVDKNDIVDFADFTILANNFGLPGDWSKGDFNGDGVVDFADFVALANNYGYELD